MRLANEAFQSMLWSTTVTPVCSAPAQPIPFSVLRSPPAASPSVLPRPPLPAPSSGIPMDIDAVWKMRSLPLRGCYQCGEANHLVKDCPHRLDIWRLTTEQRYHDLANWLSHYLYFFSFLFFSYL